MALGRISLMAFLMAFPDGLPSEPGGVGEEGDWDAGRGPAVAPMAAARLSRRAGGFSGATSVYLLILPGGWAGLKLRLADVAVTERLNDTEREQILKVLDTTGNKKSCAARISGIERKTLHRRLERMGLNQARRLLRTPLA